MKKLLTIALIGLGLSVNAQDLTTVTIQDTYFTYKTAKGSDVECKLLYKTTEEGQDISDETLRLLINNANSALIPTLKSSRSYVPISYTIKFKHNADGKHKYGVQVLYAGTNSYGGEVESIAMLEFNSKFKETAGSLMLRM